MAWGAFAGGLAKGFAAGEEIKDRARRTKAMEDELQIKKDSEKRAGERDARDAEAHGWQKADRDREEAFRTSLDELGKKWLTVGEGETFDPMNNAEHGKRWFGYQTEVYRARINSGRAGPDEMRQFAEMQEKLKDKATKQAYLQAMTTGDATALSNALGYKPGELTVTRGKDGMPVFNVGGVALPGYVVEAAATGQSPTAIRQRDEKSEGDREVRLAQIEATKAAKEASRANAAASNAGARGVPAQRMAAIREFAKEEGISIDEAAKRMRQMGVLPDERVPNNTPANMRLYSSIDKQVREANEMKPRKERMSEEEIQAEVESRYATASERTSAAPARAASPQAQPAAAARAEKPPQAFIDQLKQQPANVVITARNGSKWKHDGKGNVTQVQ